MNRFNIYASLYDKFMLSFSLYDPDFILSQIKPQKKDLVLDLAGGTGFIANKIRSHVNRVVVLDSSQPMLKQAPQNEHIHLCVGNAQKIPFSDSSFDCVICTDALHHIKRIKSVILEIKRVLKPGGRVFILEFDIKGIKGFLFWLFEKIYIDNSEFIKPDQLKNLMKESGFFGEIGKGTGLNYFYLGAKGRIKN